MDRETCIEEETVRLDRLPAAKLQSLLSQPSVDLKALREILRSGGAPDEKPKLRAASWQVLLGYLPPTKYNLAREVAKKRAEYNCLKKTHILPLQKASTVSKGGQILKQIREDMPNMRPARGAALFEDPRMIKLFERVLYIWSTRSPASVYVKGHNNILMPFVAVFLEAEVDLPVQDISLAALSAETLDSVEVASYWCFRKVLSDIQYDHTFGQLGSKQMFLTVKDLVRHIDEPLFEHLEEMGLDSVQSAFPWIDGLFVRELPLPCLLRLWDVYVADEKSFASFHVFLCAIFLLYWSPRLQEMHKEQMTHFMQNVPTGHFKTTEIETLLLEAWVVKEMYATN